MQDYDNVRKGVYKLPWDMTTLGHKQTNPLNILDKFTRWGITHVTSILPEEILGSIAGPEAGP